MTRPLHVLMLGLALALPSSPAWGLPAGDAAGCREPEPTRNYDNDSVHYRLFIDLAGCEWWDHSPVRLQATLTRGEGFHERRVDALVVCASRIFQIDDSEADSRGHQIGLSPCEIAVALDHERVEVARYRIEVTYPWKGGEHFVASDSVCVSTGLIGSCRDGR